MHSHPPQPPYEVLQYYKNQQTTVITPIAKDSFHSKYFIKIIAGWLFVDEFNTIIISAC